METRNDLLQKKENEILGIITKTCISLYGNAMPSNKIMKELISSNGLTVSAPKQEPPMMYMITLDSLNNYHSGNSIKPGNIVLNMRKLLDSIPELTVSTVGIAVDIPILKICAFLNIWKTLINIMTVEINKEQAIAISSLWENCNQNHEISVDEGYHCFERLCEQLELNVCSRKQYIQILDSLKKLQTIKINDNEIQLCECIKNSYSN